MVKGKENGFHRHLSRCGQDGEEERKSGLKGRPARPRQRDTRQPSALLKYQQLLQTLR